MMGRKREVREDGGVWRDMRQEVRGMGEQKMVRQQRGKGNIITIALRTGGRRGRKRDRDHDLRPGRGNITITTTIIIIVRRDRGNMRETRQEPDHDRQTAHTTLRQEDAEMSRKRKRRRNKVLRRLKLVQSYLRAEEAHNMRPYWIGRKKQKDGRLLARRSW